MAEEKLKYARNLVILARELGFGVNHVQKWSKKPGAPKKNRAKGGYCIESWEAFIEVEKLGQTKEEKGQSDTKKRIEEAKARNLEIDLKKKEGRTFDIDEVNEDWLTKISTARQLLKAKFVIELPPECEGLEAVEISEMNEQALDEVFEALSK